MDAAIDGRAALLVQVRRAEALAAEGRVAEARAAALDDIEQVADRCQATFARVIAHNIALTEQEAEAAAKLAGDAVKLNRVFMATAGTYDVYIGFKERLAEKAPKNTVAKIGVLKTQVTVPDFYNAELNTSTILVAEKVNMLTAAIGADEARERPFVFGAQELLPAPDMEFTKADELSIFFQVYNSGLDASGKPDLTLEYEFLKTEAGAEKFFNKTNPQVVNAAMLPPQFDPAKFPVPGGVSVPLSSFGEGQYRLAIKITDKAAKKTITRDVKFTVKG